MPRERGQARLSKGVKVMPFLNSLVEIRGHAWFQLFSSKSVAEQITELKPVIFHSACRSKWELVYATLQCIIPFLNGSMFELNLNSYIIFIVFLLLRFRVREDLILVLIKYSQYRFYTYLFILAFWDNICLCNPNCPCYLFCRPAWPQSHRNPPTCLCLPSAMIEGVCHHHPVMLWLLVCITSRENGFPCHLKVIKSKCIDST